MSESQQLDKLRAEIVCKCDHGFSHAEIEAWLCERRPKGKTLVEIKLKDVPNAIEAGKKLVDEVANPVASVNALQADDSLQDIESALREAAHRLNGADELKRVTVEEQCTAKLRSIGIKKCSQMTSAAFNPKAKDTAPDTGQAIAISDPKPWPDSVDGDEVLQELKGTIQSYVVLPDESATAAALWVLHAHIHDVAFISPFLAILSPEKRCGKTTMLQVIGAMSPRSMFASNISPAALYRSVEKWEPTLLVDEADTFLKPKDNPEIFWILNSGHSKTTAYVVRCVEPNFDAMQFSTWCPKVVAMIGNLPDTLEDRSIICRLHRKSAGDTVERLRSDRLEALEPTCQKASSWAKDNLDALKNPEPEVPSELHDRAADNWRPLLGIADTIGGDWPEHARRAAIALSCRDDADTESIRELLLSDIRDLFESQNTDRLFSEDIVTALTEMDGRPWPEFSRGKPITKAKLAKLLKPFGIQSRTIRGEDSIAKGYLLTDFEDTFSRYTPPAKRYNVTTPENIDENTISKRYTDDACNVSESAKTPANIDLLRCNVSKGGGSGDTPISDANPGDPRPVPDPDATTQSPETHDAETPPDDPDDDHETVEI